MPDPITRLNAALEGRYYSATSRRKPRHCEPPITPSAIRISIAAKITSAAVTVFSAFAFVPLAVASVSFDSLSPSSALAMRFALRMSSTGEGERPLVGVGIVPGLAQGHLLARAHLGNRPSFRSM